MKPTVRAWPFESKYLRDFAVVEERRGNLRLFPATEQLPLLSKAIDQEFHAGLTARLANTDARAADYRKYLLSECAFMFCSCLNRARPDHLNVQPYFTRDLITRVAVVQQVTAIEPAGNRHWFRFFHGDAFLPDLYLSGKRLVFSGHALERYRERTLTMDADLANNLLTNLVLQPVMLLQLHDDQPVLAFNAEGTVAVMPFTETAEECLILTTLGPDGRSRLAAFQPMRTVHLHYGPEFAITQPGDYDLEEHAAEIIRDWQAQKPHADYTDSLLKMRGHSWTVFIQAKLTYAADTGTEEMKFLFHDGVYGPVVVTRSLPPDKPLRPRRPRPPVPESDPFPRAITESTPPSVFDLPSGPPKPTPAPDWLKPPPPPA